MINHSPEIISHYTFKLSQSSYNPLHLTGRNSEESESKGETIKRFQFPLLNHITIIFTVSLK